MRRITSAAAPFLRRLSFTRFFTRFMCHSGEENHDISDARGRPIGSHDNARMAPYTCGMLSDESVCSCSCVWLLSRMRSETNGEQRIERRVE